MECFQEQCVDLVFLSCMSVGVWVEAEVGGCLDNTIDRQN